jgi:hypothetical protein
MAASALLRDGERINIRQSARPDRAFVANILVFAGSDTVTHMEMIVDPRRT